MQKAADELRSYVYSHYPEWLPELEKGKMMGVLVVRYPDGKEGYLSAFSGQIGGRSDYEGFVPAIYDYLQPDGLFKREEAAISDINHQIDTLRSSGEMVDAKGDLERAISDMDRSIIETKRLFDEHKAERHRLREAAQEDSDLRSRLLAESQFEKAELKRIKQRLQLHVDEAKSKVETIEGKIKDLDSQRKRRSAILQRWLFMNFRLPNGEGVIRSVGDIFNDANRGIPPSGTGECAAPKLLYYALRHNLVPMHIGEFWWGASPKNEIRRDGAFYGACQAKCAPILTWMLKGIDVDMPQVYKNSCKSLDIVFEDDDIVVVDKPSGLLSVPGVASDDNAQSRLQAKYPHAECVLAVHRLDLATSGLLVFAKNLATYKRLQEAFATRQVRKRYVATLDGIVERDKGVIDLSIEPDYDNRPRQRVSATGSRAITEYEVVERDFEANRTKVNFYPHTGRTHQLRIHSAHQDGLGCPIVGDELYGTPTKEGLQLRAVEVLIDGKRIILD
ncbi:MAG: pseudouridine synthase [Bacteroidales bacterium]|nr:pseudouridine synthase [Bacteroidales bacterium]